MTVVSGLGGYMVFILVLFMQITDAQAQSEHHVPPSREAAAQSVMAAKNRSALPGFAWFVLDDEERKQILAAEMQKEHWAEEVEGLRRDLELLLAPREKTEDLAESYDLKVLQLKIAQMARALDENPNDSELVELLEQLALTTIPVEFQQSAPNKERQRMMQKLSRLSELFAFGTLEAAKSQAAGDTAAAEKNTKAALRAWMEAYSTGGMTTGKKADLYRSALRVDLGAFLVTFFGAMANLANFPNSGWAQSLLIIPAMVGAKLQWDAIQHARASDFEDDYLSTRAEKPPPAPIRPYFRRRMLLEDADRAIHFFWKMVRTRNLNQIPGFREIDNRNPDKMEIWAGETLRALSTQPLVVLAQDACDRALGLSD
jgi:hypothetical protein